MNNTPESHDEGKSANNVAKADTPVKSHKLPRFVRLDNAHRIKVKLLSKEEMKHVAPDSDELGGLWNDRTETIYILKGQSSDEQWYYFRHELLHALNDVMHWKSNPQAKGKP